MSGGLPSPSARRAGPPNLVSPSDAPDCVTSGRGTQTETGKTREGAKPQELWRALWLSMSSCAMSRSLRLLVVEARTRNWKARSASIS